MYTAELPLALFLKILYSIHIVKGKTQKEKAGENVDAASRILTIRLLQRMQQDPAQAQKLGLTDRSTFHGQSLSRPAPKEN